MRYEQISSIRYQASIICCGNWDDLYKMISNDLTVTSRFKSKRKPELYKMMTSVIGLTSSVAPNKNTQWTQWGWNKPYWEINQPKGGFKHVQAKITLIWQVLHFSNHACFIPVCTNQEFSIVFTSHKWRVWPTNMNISPFKTRTE